jgi:hypothetical protein
VTAAGHTIVEEQIDNDVARNPCLHE